MPNDFTKFFSEGKGFLFKNAKIKNKKAKIEKEIYNSFLYLNIRFIFK